MLRGGCGVVWLAFDESLCTGLIVVWRVGRATSDAKVVSS